jgi:hypothetical protein
LRTHRHNINLCASQYCYQWKDTSYYTRLTTKSIKSQIYWLKYHTVYMFIFFSNTGTFLNLCFTIYYPFVLGLLFFLNSGWKHRFKTICVGFFFANFSEMVINWKLTATRNFLISQYSTHMISYYFLKKLRKLILVVTVPISTHVISLHDFYNTFILYNLQSGVKPNQTYNLQKI